MVLLDYILIVVLVIMAVLIILVLYEWLKQKELEKEIREHRFIYDMQNWNAMRREVVDRLVELGTVKDEEKGD